MIYSSLNSTVNIQGLHREHVTCESENESVSMKNYSVAPVINSVLTVRLVKQNC